MAQVKVCVLLATKNSLIPGRCHHCRTFFKKSMCVCGVEQDTCNIVEWCLKICQVSPRDVSNRVWQFLGGISDFLNFHKQVQEYAVLQFVKLFQKLNFYHSTFFRSKVNKVFRIKLVKPQLQIIPKTFEAQCEIVPIFVLAHICHRAAQQPIFFPKFCFSFIYVD